MMAWAMPDGTAYVHCHAAGASVMEWDNRCKRVADMVVLKGFYAKHPAAVVNDRIMLLNRHVEAAQAAAYRWADAYNAPGPQRERRLREAGT